MTMPGSTQRYAQPDGYVPLPEQTFEDREAQKQPCHHVQKLLKAIQEHEVGVYPSGKGLRRVNDKKLYEKAEKIAKEAGVNAST